MNTFGSKKIFILFYIPSNNVSQFCVFTYSNALEHTIHVLDIIALTCAMQLKEHHDSLMFRYILVVLRILYPHQKLCGRYSMNSTEVGMPFSYE